MTTYSLEELHAMGWIIDLTSGLHNRHMCSFAMILQRNGAIVTQFSGIGRDYDAALSDAVARANDWLRRQSPEERAAWHARAGLKPGAGSRRAHRLDD